MQCKNLLFFLVLANILTLSLITGQAATTSQENTSTTPSQTAKTFYIPITINSAFGMGFMGSMMFGTPSQTLPILFDSGANSFQVSSDSCTGCTTYTCSTPATTCPTPLPMFKNSKSSTYSEVWKSPNYSVQYGGTGVSTGPYSVSDTVTAVGANGMNLVVPKLTFNTITSGTQLSGISGDCGMGKTSPFVPGAFKAGLIPSNEFSTYFNPSIGSGYIFIGGTDASVTPTPVWYHFTQFSTNKAWNLGFNALNGISTNPTGEKINLDFGAGIQQIPSYFNVPQFWQSISTTGTCSMYGNYLQCNCLNNKGVTDMKPLVINLLLSNGKSVEFSLPAQYYLTYIPAIPGYSKVSGNCRTNIQFVTSTGLSPRLSATWQQYFYMNYNIATTDVQIAANPSYSTANSSPATPVPLLSGYAW